MAGARDAVLSELELADLRILGVDVEDNLSITVYNITHILGSIWGVGSTKVWFCDYLRNGGSLCVCEG